ncbi:MAG: 50S ribosomal protein L6 [Bacteroidales bacterium]|nr:50S ribosomal protein L6 [Bacteroidales bacterium]
MSRIGKLPINIPDGVKIDVSDDNVVTVKGKLGELTQKIHKDIKFEFEGNVINVTRPSDSKTHKAFHGLSRVLVFNMLEGVSKGFEKKLEVIGVGYRASVSGKLLELQVGYSHPIILQLPEEVSAEVQQEKRANAFITVKSFDKQLLGEVAAKIRSFRKPEPYKGKGIRYVGEYVRKKVGKAATD